MVSGAPRRNGRISMLQIQRSRIFPDFVPQNVIKPEMKIKLRMEGTVNGHPFVIEGEGKGHPFE